MKKLRKRHSGEGYIDVCVLVVCAMLVLALAVRILPVFVAKQQLDSFVGGPAAVERSPHPYRQNPGFAGKRCTIQLFTGKRHPVYAAAS